MFLGELSEKLKEEGWGDREVSDVILQISLAYPELYAQADMMPMSAGIAPYPVPEEVVRDLLGRGPQYQDNPFYIEATQEERMAILKKARELNGGMGDKRFHEKLEDEVMNKDLLSIYMGNLKLGKTIQNWSLPVGQPERGGSCPGASAICESVCYIKSGRHIIQQIPGYYANWALVETLPEKWVRGMVKHIQTPIFRIHVGGDFYSIKYLRLWMEIIKKSPYTRFFAYTRSWNDGKGNIQEEWIEPLTEMANLSNMRLLLSVDRDTGIPNRDIIPGTIRAWMATDDEPPSRPVELAFRDSSFIKKEIASAKSYRGRIGSKKLPEKTREKARQSLDILKARMSNIVLKGNFTVDNTKVPVCPEEANLFYVKSLEEIQCNKCGWCFSFLHAAQGVVEETKMEIISMAARQEGEKSVRVLARHPIAANPGTCRVCNPDCWCGWEDCQLYENCVYCGCCCIC